uniref:Choline transporter-like protein n=1 Tax=Strombidium rassoulzadegani TaxID=1082188 RepID=A0A7S3FVB3_9SPIT|mmetsp:Transcript_4354/g.7345  ORF Transcript_4354/g.7345 Transcript_4354/m.7345 type:complete len:440 (+) Transcript_4354:520-1839(+)
MSAEFGLSSAIVDIKEAWKALLIMSAVSFVITIIYIFLLRWITKPLLYTSLLLIFVLGLLVGYFVWTKKDEYPAESNNYKYAMALAIVVWVITALYALFVCCQWGNIALGASIMEASGDFVSKNTRVGLMPLIAYIVTIPITLWWGASAVYIYSIGEPSYEENTMIAKINLGQEATYMFWVFLFGLFWIVAFVIALSQFIIATTACMWYFSGDGSDSHDGDGNYGVLMATKWGFSYHMGSVAFGAFLIAVITMIKVIFEYFAKKYESVAGKDNFVFKAVTCCIRCCIWALDSYIKFINENAYIQIALHNSSFCKAAQESFYLMIRHAGRFSSVGVVGWIMTFLGKGVIVGLSMWLTILLVEQSYTQVQQPIVPAVLVGIVAWVIASLFLSIFDYSSLAILHCFIVDQDFGGSAKTPDSLKNFLDFNDEQVAKKNKVNPK